MHISSESSEEEEPMLNTRPKVTAAVLCIKGGDLQALTQHRAGIQI